MSSYPGPYVSLHGHAYGFDPSLGTLIRHGKEGNAGNEVVTTASTATTIVPRGTTLLAATAATDYTMAAPIAGVRKVLYCTGGTTLAQTVTLAAGTFQTTVGTSVNKASFDLLGEKLELVGLSTTRYLVLTELTTLTVTMSTA